MGLSGYQNILTNEQLQNINIPIYAIGGIAYNDIEKLTNIGIYGIAVSGLITQNPQIITQLNEKLYAGINI